MRPTTLALAALLLATTAAAARPRARHSSANLRAATAATTTSTTSSTTKQSSVAALFSKVERQFTEDAIRKNGRKQFDFFVSGVEYRHELMLSCLDPVLASKRRATWLTLGDVWGREAIYIHKHGGHATASSLQDGAIKAATEWGYIDGYALQNAEAMTYADDTFDFTFIKEAFHHLARPYAGIYEMIRVAKTAAILFEPADEPVLSPPVTGVNASIFGRVFTTDFEVCGFQYRLNPFEMVKTAMALNLPAVAFRGWNDPYKEPLETTVQAEYEATLREINAMGARGERHYNLMAVVFLKKMDADLVRALKAADYMVMPLQQYVDRGQCV